MGGSWTPSAVLDVSTEALSDVTVAMMLLLVPREMGTEKERRSNQEARVCAGNMLQ